MTDGTGTQPSHGVEDELLSRIFDISPEDRVATSGKETEETPKDEESVYHQGLESLQDQKETEEGMAQAFEVIEKKKPGVWAIFRMQNKRVVDAQRGIERGLSRMGRQGKLPIMQLAALAAFAVVASSALGNKSLVAYVATSLAVRTTQYEVLGFAAAVAVVVVFLARSGRLSGGGSRKA